MPMSRAGALLAGAMLALGAGAGAQTPPLVELSIPVVTPASPELAVMIADKQGFFREQGLHVTLVTAGSPANVISLVATGGGTIAISSTDSLMGGIAHGLSYKFIAPGFAADPYTLVTVPSVTTWAQLKGQKVLLGQKLDVSGISFSRMAAAHGMTMDDFDIAVAGSTTARYTGLLSGQVQATMISAPFDILAESKGMHVLAVSHDYVKNWMFQGIVANTTWLAEHRPVAVGFLRALRKAIQYGYAHPDVAESTLVAETNVAPDIAKTTYDLGWRQWHAFDPDLRFDLAGMRAVAEGAVASKILTAMPDLASMIDPSVRAEALR